MSAFDSIVPPSDPGLEGVDEASKRRSMTFSMPLSGVVDSRVNIVGEFREVKNNETEDYETAFAVSDHHVSLFVDAVSTGGDIVITGTSLSESTAVPVPGDSETITIDTTQDQWYQTEKKWWEVTSIDVESGSITGIDYDIWVCGYADFGNNDFEITGMRTDFYLQSDNADATIQIIKIQDDGDKKMSVSYVENIGFDANGSGDQIIDNLRTGAADRSYDPTVDHIALNNTTLCLKQGDYETYFAANESLFRSSDHDEGFILRIAGAPSGGISGVDVASIHIYYTMI